MRDVLGGKPFAFPFGDKPVEIKLEDLLASMPEQNKEDYLRERLSALLLHYDVLLKPKSSDNTPVKVTTTNCLVECCELAMKKRALNERADQLRKELIAIEKQLQGE